MKYYFKENFHLLYASGQLYDSHDQVAYSYENTTVMFPEIDLFYRGRRVGHVKKNFSLFLRNYDIYVGDELEDSLQQELTLFRPSLYLERRGWIISGDFFALNYEIRDSGGKIICEVNQEMFRLTRRYYVDVRDESQEPFIILLVLAINQFDKDSASSAHSSSSHHN